MKDTPTPWRVFALLVAAAAACGSEPQIEGTVAPAPPAIPATPAMADETPTPPVAAAPEAKQSPAVSSPNVPLEKLFQLPAAGPLRPAEPDINKALNRETFVGPPEPEETAKERKLRLEIEARTEAPIERHEMKREQVDAGAALEVGKDTSLKGGVRVERDSSGSKSTNVGTTPSIGIEKRF